MAFIIAGLGELAATIVGYVLPEILTVSEVTPLLATQTVQSVLPFLPEATATAIGMADLGGITGAQALAIGQTAYNAQTALGRPMLPSEFATYQDQLKRENWNPNANRKGTNVDYDYEVPTHLRRDGTQINYDGSRPQPLVIPTGTDPVAINPNFLSNIPFQAQDIFNQGLVKINSMVQNQNKMTGQQLTTDSKGQILDPFKIGKDLGKFIGLTENELYKGESEVGAYKKVSMSFPELAYLVANVTGFSKYTPRPDVMAKVNAKRAVYTGANCTPENTFVDENGNIGGINEFGIREIYDGSRGNMPAYDVFCGPDSPNNKRPTTLFGTYCMFHDIGYLRNGYFDLESDLILCARILNNLSKMGFQERVLAMTACHYFLTTGNSIAMFKNILPSNVNEKPVTYPAQDISAYIFGTQLQPVKRMNFYEGMKQGLDEHLKMSMMPSRYNSTTLLPLFDSIEVLEANYYVIEEEQQTPQVPVVPITQPVDVPLSQVPEVIAEESLPTTATPETHSTPTETPVETPSVPTIPEQEYETPLVAVA